MMIFPQKRMKPELMDGMPAGSISMCHPSGWMQMSLFERWFRHFLQHSDSSAQNPSLLILDGHTHTKNIAVIDLARQFWVTLMVIPSHAAIEYSP